MQRRRIVSLIKGLFLLQLFVLIMLGGISGSFQGFPLLTGPAGPPAPYLALFNRIVIGENLALKMFAESSFLSRGEQLHIFDPEYLEEVFPQALLTASIQALAYTPAKDGDLIVFEDEAPYLEEVAKAPIETEPAAVGLKGGKILLYCTHSAETFIPDQGKARVDGKRGLINQVAQNLGQQLQSQGLDCEFVDTIHDWPDYVLSYSNSRHTIKEFLDRHQLVTAVFDIHRDSLPGAKAGETVVINGQRCAPVLIIVGTNERKDHPHWKKNLAFAQALYLAGEAKYPGLIKGVRTKAGTYNQEYHHRALLLEIGQDLNSCAEAHYAAELFSHILVEVLEAEGS